MLVKPINFLVHIRLAGAALLTALCGCSSAVFKGVTPVEVRDYGSINASQQKVASCEILNRVHPGIDPLIFDVKVSDPGLRLNDPDRITEVPSQSDDSFIFKDVFLPLNAEGHVVAEVFFPESALTSSGGTGLSEVAAQKRISGKCSLALLPPELVASPLKEVKTADGELKKASFELVWNHLLDGELFQFVSDKSKISADLSVTCDPAGPPALKTSDHKESSRFSQLFNCLVQYMSPVDVKSMRYKGQEFAWDLIRMEKTKSRLVSRRLVIDLIRSQGSSAGGVGSGVNQSVVDPESCKPMPGFLGMQFTHICSALERLPGQDGVTQNLCKVVDPCP
jgi:hypothetical protein